MQRLDSPQGWNAQCRSELSVTGARARRVRANPPETRPRDGTAGTVVSNKRNSKASVHIARRVGHKRADCRTRLVQQKSGAAAGV